MERLYTASATALSGREGKVSSSDGIIDLDLRLPRELGGPGGGTNPEQLFASGYAACFGSALNLVIRTKKIQAVVEYVTAHVTIGKDSSDGGFMLEVKLDVKFDDVDDEIARQLVEAAHQVCPYSKATRGNIQVELAIV